MKSTIGRNPRYIFVAALPAWLLAACAGSFSDIDRRTDEVVRQRSASLLGATVRPELTGRGLDSPAGGDHLTQKHPPSNDPAAGQLSLTPADEARDVAARLAKYGDQSAGAVALDLTASLKQAQRTSREYLRAQEDYLLAAINLLIERHLWDPRFFASTTAQATATGVDGDFTAPLSIINELRATQRLPSGGQVEARFLWDATQQLRDSATGRYVQASALVVSASIPLLRGAGLAAREDLTQQERNLVYAARAFETARRTLLVELSRDYFDLLQQQRTMENQERALDLLKKLELRTTRLVEAGRLAEFEKNIAANDVLRATSQLASQRERFILALDRFKVRIGIDINTPAVVKSEIPLLPEPETTPGEAARAALDYRLDLQTSRDRHEDAQRRVLVAENNTLADATLFGAVTARTDPNRSVGRTDFSAGDGVYNAGVRVDWPLDRENERLAVRGAQIDSERARRDVESLRDTVVIESRAAAREIDRARFSLNLAEQAVKINLRRAKEQELKADEITAQQIVDTANALRDAENSRDQAVTDLRNAVLDYLLTTGQLRVTADGLLMLPGESGTSTEGVPPAGNPTPEIVQPIDAPANP
ncbi:MAG: TolC family protein [Phycisphaerales bacterium]|nr:TolC family protein [Phycisphaerales bacterium]